MAFVTKRIDSAKRSRSLDLNFDPTEDEQLEEIPQIIYDTFKMRRDTGKGLAAMFISNHRISSISSQIALLKNLRAIDISRNRLKLLPPEISQLARLERLDVKGNSIKQLPDEFKALIRLRELYLNENKFSSIPPEVFKMKRLLVLSLSNNHIEALPAKLTKLRVLNDLSLDNNCLTDEGISRVDWADMSKHLRVIGLSGNEEVTAIPTDIFSLKNICTIRPPSNANIMEAKYLNFVNANIYKQDFDESLKLRPSQGELERIAMSKLKKNKIREVNVDEVTIKSPKETKIGD